MIYTLEYIISSYHSKCTGSNTLLELSDGSGGSGFTMGDEFIESINNKHELILDTGMGYTHGNYYCGNIYGYGDGDELDHTTCIYLTNVYTAEYISNLLACQ